MKSSEMTTAVVSKVHVVVEFPDTESAEVLADAANTVPYVRLAAQLVDTPPNVLHSDAYIAIARDIATELGVSITVIQGQELEAQGLGGIWGVGKAAEHLPALVILSHVPQGANAEDPSICFVGKGIVYDTGGLSIKTPTTFMAGMKMDMGGSAAVLGAFAAAVRNRSVAGPLHALLCIAENAVGPLATRPDDVHTFLSGKTVEVNNTDAEGRLVLADGVFYAHKFLNARVIIDIATLTGAQLIATGRNHAALYCNDEELEALAVVQGKYTGDLTHPMPYVPEFYRGEFKSAVADMKNSVADRSNAQVSCAGQFIGNHLEEFFARGGKWLHVDMAGPAMAGERGTGYGVALLSNIAKNL
jgi:probable aminopeptidase NPEPL1